MTTISLTGGGPQRSPLVFLRRTAIAAAALLTAFAAGPATRADTAPPTAPAETSGLVQVDDMHTGALLLKSTEAGKYLEAPRLKTDVAITVTGPIARARITQRFENPTDKWVEGVYVFPLPQNSGVDTLRMQIGDRFLEGDVKERQEARQIYEKAAAAGIKTTLIEQQRPNMFTNSVANIGPHETIVVQIEYQEAIRLDGDKLSLRVPLVVGPRYNPLPQPVFTGVAYDDSAIVSVSAPVPDRDAITPPVLHPNYGKINPVTLKVTLKSGVALAAIESQFHPADIARPDDKTATIELKGPVPADRDFVLNWKLAANAAPQATLYRETIGADSYYLAMIVPPVGTTVPKRQPREAIFVIDNSGSMAGESMGQAKKALSMALKELKPGDKFNVVRFDDTLEVLFQDAVPADAAHITTAYNFVTGLEANGGTEIYPALQAALVDRTPNDKTRLRQVIFLTDGAVGNEDQVLAEIGKSLGRSRLFTVGIGSAPNSFLMEHIARLGRGTFTHIGSESEVDARMTELFNKLESPVMTDLRVADGVKLETWPNPVPDLYAGEPVVLTAVTPAQSGKVRIEGRMGQAPWSAMLDLATAVDGNGVSKLWARSKIGAIEDLRYHGAKEGDVDAEVLKVALAHHLVSRVTSLVAVDVTPSRPDGETLTSSEMPTNLPHGWNFEKVFGEDPAHPYVKASLDETMLTKLAMADTPKGKPGEAEEGVALPQTDAGTDLLLLLSALFSLSGIGLAALVNRKPVRK
ncbi:MAG: marine proteobacterial sortase target protein [Alphaproteobacteria bacterium]|nr:marine proteobacterial sortase target protein [Alphaproteobacteria bacterium]